MRGKTMDSASETSNSEDSDDDVTLRRKRITRYCKMFSLIHSILRQCGDWHCASFVKICYIHVTFTFSIDCGQSNPTDIVACYDEFGWQVRVNYGDSNFLQSHIGCIRLLV